MLIRRMALSQIGELPLGYRRCTYIESTRTQWIDTEFYPNIGTKARVVFSPIQTNGIGFFGARKDPNRFSCTTFSLGTSFAFSVSVGSWSGNKTKIKLGSIYDCVTENGVQIINGAQYTEPTVSSLGDCGSFKLATLDMRGDVVTTNESNPNACRWFSVQLWDDGKLERNMIPALDTNGKPCMYDTISKQIFYNQGTGEFLYELA